MVLLPHYHQGSWKRCLGTQALDMLWKDPHHRYSLGMGGHSIDEVGVPACMGGGVGRLENHQAWGHSETRQRGYHLRLQ